MSIKAHAFHFNSETNKREHKLLSWMKGSSKAAAKETSAESAPTGFPSTLSDQQQEELKTLKILINSSKYKDEILNHPSKDVVLLRVLRATMKDKKSKRLFNSKKALERIENIFEFKLKYNLKEKPENFEQYRKVYPRFTYKDRKLKKIIYINRVGDYINHAKVSHFKTEEWKQFVGYDMEAIEQGLLELEEETGEECRGYYAIADHAGVKLTSLLSNSKAIIMLGNIAGDMYPETIEKVYITNVPWVYSKVYNTIKPLLDAETASKFIISSGIPDEIKESFDLDQLPKEYGGNNKQVVPYPLDVKKKYNEQLICYEYDISETVKTGL